jgi:hypothetical protein
MIVKQSLPKVRIHDLAGKGRHRCRDLADDVLGNTEFAQCLHQVDRDRIEVPLLDGESALGIAHGRAAILLRAAQCLQQEGKLMRLQPRHADPAEKMTQGGISQHALVEAVELR